jgi:hypothetical protein
VETVRIQFAERLCIQQLVLAGCAGLLRKRDQAMKILPFLLLAGCVLLSVGCDDFRVVAPVSNGVRIERDTTTVIIDTIHAPDKRCAECWDSVAVLNQRIEVLEDMIYHGGE